MSDKTWSIKPCFAGPDCWCRIIVDPDGQECTFYGELGIDDCQFIIDAMNRTPGAENNAHPTHPIPWFIMKYGSNGHYQVLVTEKGLTEDNLEHSIGGVYEDYIERFAEAVNGFYKREAK